jgi:hypothetical protein
VEFFREGPMVLPWLSLAQLVCLIMAISAFSLIIIFNRRFHKGVIGDAVSEINH